MRNNQLTDSIKRILIVDDHPLICKGLTQLINGEEDLSVCGDACDINAAIEMIAALEPHAVIVDISLKGSSGIDLLKAIKVRYPDLPALVYSMHDESVFAERALKAGARGYLMKDQPAEVLIEAIRKILAGNLYFSDKIITSLLGRINNIVSGGDQHPIKRLTDRELEIFQLIGEEMKNSKIATKLNISIKTVEAHREHIRRKLDIIDSSELIKYAKEWIQGKAGTRADPPSLKISPKIKQ
jgi:DNA-binding NarL/FixJ family response regulator